MKESTRKCNISDFLEIKNPKIAYFLGLLWADGCVSKTNNTVSFQLVESDASKIKDDIIEVIPNISVRYIKREPPRQNVLLFTLSDANLKNFLVSCDFLIKTGCSADKILDKIPENLKKYWWRGYFEGDGSVTYNRRTKYSIAFSFAACKKQDWKFAIDLLNNTLKLNKYIINLDKKGADKGTSTFVVSGLEKCRRFYNYIYSGDNFGIQRKKSVFEKYFEIKSKLKNSYKSKYTGVTIDNKSSNKKYRARIHVCKKTFELGHFENEIEAAKAYNLKAIELHGDEATLNII